MKLSLLFTSNVICIASSFTPAVTTSLSVPTLQATLGDEIRASQSLFNNIPFTSRSTENGLQNAISSGESVRENGSGYAPISQSTGQVGTYGVIGDMYDRNAPIDYNSHKSAQPAPFVPHSSTGTGGVQMRSAASYHGGRRAPTDYNSCKSFWVSENELSYFQSGSHSPFNAAGFTPSESTVAPSRNEHIGPIDYNSHEVTAASTKTAPFVPHSSTGAGGTPMSAASPSYRGAHLQQ